VQAVSRSLSRNAFHLICCSACWSDICLIICQIHLLLSGSYPSDVYPSLHQTNTRDNYSVYSVWTPTSFHHCMCHATVKRQMSSFSNYHRPRTRAAVLRMEEKCVGEAPIVYCFRLGAPPLPYMYVLPGLACLSNLQSASRTCDLFESKQLPAQSLQFLNSTPSNRNALDEISCALYLILSCIASTH
jgi:hypothetical protein